MKVGDNFLCKISTSTTNHNASIHFFRILPKKHLNIELHKLIFFTVLSMRLNIHI